MAILNNDRRCLSIYVLVGLVLLQVYLSSSESQGNSQNSAKHSRLRRQGADFRLMSKNVESALRTTLPSSFFLEIGKRRQVPDAYSKFRLNMLPRILTGNEGAGQQNYVPSEWMQLSDVDVDRPSPRQYL